MPRGAQKVGAVFLHVDIGMPGALRGVEQKEGALFPRDLSYGGGVGLSARYVGNVIYRDEIGVFFIAAAIASGVPSVTV